tara:strand:- start:1073 stop:1411 length:339 start_codon:yes stop_codon:yes gene_type:complete
MQNNISKVHKIDHVAINVSNIDRSILWYVNKCSAEVLYRDDSWGLLKVGTSKLALTLAHEHPPHIAISCSSIDQFPFSHELIKTHRDGSKYLYTEDLDGNVIEWIYYPHTNI